MALAEAALVKPKASSDDLIMRAGIAVVLILLALFVAAPLWTLLSKSFHNADGTWVGLDNYIRYVSTPALLQSLWNSLFIAIVSTVIVVPLAVAVPCEAWLVMATDVAAPPDRLSVMTLLELS